MVVRKQSVCIIITGIIRSNAINKLNNHPRQTDYGFIYTSERAQALKSSTTNFVHGKSSMVRKRKIADK